MSAKIKSLGFIVLIFVAWSVVYYEIVIGTVSERKDILFNLKEYRKQLATASSEAEVIQLLESSDKEYLLIVEDADILFNAFVVV